MNELVLDVETTTYNKGNPFDSRNKLVSIHSYDGEQSCSYKADDWIVQEFIDWSTLVIGFNFKFDLTWLRKAEFYLTGKKIWDVQLAHYMLHGETFPSLDSVLSHYGLPLKINKVKEYWDQGVQTDEIPWDVLCEYGEYDVQGTYDCYVRQKEEFLAEPQLYQLFRIRCMDLEILAEMEWNGLKYNSDKCATKAVEVQERIDQLNEKLKSIYPEVPINFNSNKQLSAFLYGGEITEDYREADGFYKTGQKAGMPKMVKRTRVHQLPPLFDPLPGSEMETPGVYSTSESTLRSLKGRKDIIELLLELAKLDKLKSTYYEGLNKINAEMHWPKDKLHGQYNQCQTATGRLSSSRPNQQNFSEDILDLFESRYED